MEKGELLFVIAYLQPPNSEVAEALNNVYMP